MIRRGWTASAVAAGAGLAAMLAAHAQEPGANPQGTPTFRTAASLVTVDAVVVDDDGRHVTDLGAADFEVVHEGRVLPVRQAVYVPIGQAAAAQASGQTRAGNIAAAREPAIDAPLPGRLGRSPAVAAASAAGSRVIAVVVDDLGLSFRSTADTRRALTRFVDEQVQPGDLVAILRAGAGVGALQQFTTDKRLLHAAVDRVRWTITSRSGIGAFAPVTAPDALGAQTGGGSGTAEHEDEDSIEGLRTSMLVAGSLGALEYVIRGVEHLPGRKAVVFVSEGFRLFSRSTGFRTSRGGDRIWNAFTRVMDRANRAGVVVYALDPRGLVTGGLTAEDNPQPAAPPPGPGGGESASAAAGRAVLEGARTRYDFLLDSQASLTSVAEQTGGFAVLNTNDLNLGLRRVLEDLRGYYLLGFELPAAARAWDPGELRIRVKRERLHVRARRGLFGPADPATPPDAAAAADPLTAAALSPFTAGAMDVRLTALFAHDPKLGSFVRALFFIDPAGVTFTRTTDGGHAADLALLLMTVGDNGQPTSHFRRGVTLRLADEEHVRTRARGILYSVRIPVEDPGGYQLRAAVRDGTSGALGSGSQFFEVPRVGRGRLAMSSVVLQGTGEADGRALAADAPDGLAPVAFSGPGVRIFRPGSDAVYTCEIYDGQPGRSDPLVTYATLIRDGRRVYESTPAPVARRPTDAALHVIPVAGSLSLSRSTPPGLYTLQVTIARRRGNQVVAQTGATVDFEVR